MKLYLIRHGESGSSPAGDAERMLTARGMERLRVLGLELKIFTEAPKLLLTSPLKRAQQTAELLQEAWSCPVQIAQWLAPGDSVSTQVKRIQEIGEDIFGMVGHLPSMGLLLSYFTQGLPPRDISMAPGSVALLELVSWNPGQAKLCWIRSPSLE